MRQRPVSERLRVARANIRLAAQICAVADLDRLQRAIDLLESTVTEMTLAEAQLRSAIPQERAELQQEAILLKREIAGMVRVIDGYAALYRGLAVRLGCAPLAYTPQGHTVAASPSAAACEVQA